MRSAKIERLSNLNSTRLYHDLYHLDLDTNQPTLIEKNDKYLYLHFDDTLEPVIAQTINGDGTQTVYYKKRPLFTLTAEDAFHTETVELIGNTLYLNDNRHSNTTQLKKVDLSHNKEQVLGHDPKSDIQSVLFDGKELIAYTTYYSEKEWHPLTKRAEEELHFLLTEFGPNFEVTDQKENYWIIRETRLLRECSSGSMIALRKKLSFCTLSPPSLPF